MPGSIYTGSGEYDAESLMAVYNAFLPELPSDQGYEFKTGTIYNISCEDYPNRILIFMRVYPGENVDLTTTATNGETNNKETIVFSVHKDFVEDINSDARPLNRQEDIEVILYHDMFFDNDYVANYLACAPASAYEQMPNQDSPDGEGLESTALFPKKGKKGTLSIKNLKP